MKTEKQIIERLEVLDNLIGEFVFYSLDENGEITDQCEIDEWHDLHDERDFLKSKLTIRDRE